MRTRTMGGLAAAAALAISLAGAAPGHADSTSAQGSPPAGLPALPADQAHACGVPDPGTVYCHAIQLVDPAQNWHGQRAGRVQSPAPAASTSPPSGYGPVDLQTAYGLGSVSASSGAGRTVAIVDAYDDANAASDLNHYRAYLGLPALNQGGPTFTKYNQNGKVGSYPRGNTGWAEEISLDLDMVSAICPNCNIALVEASSNSYANLGTAVNTAARLGAVAISNSYGGSDSSSDGYYDTSYFHHSGIAVTASTGDNGFGVEYPAASQYVTAVGGTSLTSASPGSEVAWSGAGSGCSAYEPQPSWQSSVANITGVCHGRAVADVSATADPNYGVGVYDTYHEPGWMVFGGTSVASPIVASVYALSGANLNNSFPYSATSALNDVTFGSNGSCGNVLCNATTGWDGPTGLGSPKGDGAF